MDLHRSLESKNTGPCCGIRHLQCFLVFLGLSVTFAMRVNLSVAIVAMTDEQHSNGQVTFEWSEKTKSLVLSSFFWGYFVTQIPGGHLAQKYGAKVLLLQAIFISAILNMLTPFCVSIGNWQLLCAVRIVEGLSQGVIYPSVQTVLAKWAPVEERGTLATYAYCGSQFGTVLMLAFSGVLASSSIGWPCIFYASGFVGVMWSIVWLIWGASCPSEYKGISEDEKKYIENSLGKNIEEETEKVKLKTPWKKIFTSVPFWVLAIVHCGNNWGFWTLLTQIPSYMKYILGMDIKSNALLSALPYFAMLLLSFVFVGITKVLNRTQALKLGTSRKLFNTIAQWIPMLTLIGLGYLGSDQVRLAVVLLTITIGVNSAIYLGFSVNHIDLSPNFAGVLMGLTNCAANVMSFISPLVVGIIVNDVKNPDQWRIVFFIAAGFYFVGNLLFIVFGTADVQPWNEPPSIMHEMEPLQRHTKSHEIIAAK